MSPAPAMATRAFEVASSSVAGACSEAPGDEIAGRAVINRNAALLTSARIFRVMQKLLFIFSVRKIRERESSGCDAAPRLDTIQRGTHGAAEYIRIPEPRLSTDGEQNRSENPKTIPCIYIARSEPCFPAGRQEHLFPAGTSNTIIAVAPT